jgi:hypothetical protein
MNTIHPRSFFSEKLTTDILSKYLNFAQAFEAMNRFPCSALATVYFLLHSFRIITPICSLFILPLLACQQLHAQAPANDNRANATVLSGDTASASSTNANATVETGDYDFRTVWWRWTVGGSGLASFSTTGSTAPNLNLQIYLLEGGVATGRAAYTTGTSVSLPVASGTTYLIGVGAGSTGSAAGTVQMSVSLNMSHHVGGLNVPNAATMANDSFAQRISLTGANVSGIAYNNSATREAGEPVDSGNNTHWWTYTPPSTGRLSVSTQGSSTSFNKTVVIYLGTSLADLKPFIIRSASEVDSFIFPVTAGTTYVISTGSGNPGFHGSTVLTCSLQSGTGVDVSGMNIPNQATMANDSFSSAVTLSGRNVSAIAYNYPATRETSEPSTTGNNTFWWRHEVVENGRLSISTTGSSTSFNKTLCIFMGTTLGGLRLVDFQENAASPGLSLPVTAGTVFYISTGSSNPYFHGSWVISLDLQTGTGVDISGMNIPNQATMTNDSFAQAVSLTGDNVSAIAYNLTATRENGEPTSTGHNTFWWRTRPSKNGRLAISTRGSGTDFKKNVMIYQGSSFAGLRLVAFAQETYEVDMSFPVTANTDYVISTGSSNPYYLGHWVFTLDLQSGTGVDISALNIPNPATMANDSLAGAVTLSGRQVSGIAYNYWSTRETGEPTISGQNTHWWRYTTDAAGILTVSTQGSSAGYNKTVVVYQGTNFADLRPVATVGSSEIINFSLPVTANTTYYISTGSANEFFHGNIVLTLGLQTGSGVPVSLLNLPTAATMANDAFAGRVTLFGVEVSAIGYTLGATRQALEPTATGERTLWWSWVAPTSGNAVVDFTGTTVSNFTASVWQGTDAAALTQIPLGSWAGLQNTFPVTAGQTYLLATGTPSTSTSGSAVVLTLTAAPSKPVFTSPLASRWVETGEPFQITPDVSANGTTFKWQRNGSTITGVVSRVFQVGSAGLANAGAYRVEATNSLGSTFSGVANVGVMQMGSSSVTANEGGTLKLVVNVAGPTGSLSFRWMKGGVDLADGRIGTQTTSGSGSTTISISGLSPSAAGDYACRVTLANAAEPANPLSKVSSTTTVTLRYRPVVSDTPPPASPAVAQPFTWQLGASNSPTSFAANGLPAGLKLDPATGLVTGEPTAVSNARVSITATNAAGVSAARVFTFSIGVMRTGLAGTYSGLVSRHGALNASLGGTISTTISSTGALTGTLKLGALSHPLTGRVRATPSAPATATLVIKRSRLPVLTVMLTFATDGSLGGEVFEGETLPANPLNIAQADGRLHTWRLGNTAANHAGAYNVLLDLPPSLAGDRGTPQGYGYLQLGVTAATGAVNITGRTPDGATITASSTLWPDGTAPLHALLYTNKGSIRGLPRITLGGSAPLYADSRVTGEVDWQKTGPASSSDRTYATGFGPITLDADGSKWVRPPAGTMLFGLPNQPANFRIELAEAGIESSAQAASVDQIFQLLPTGSCKFATATNGNPTGMSLSITTSTGLFTGSFKLTDPKPGSSLTTSRSVKTSGLLIPHLLRGYGHFLLPEIGTSPPVKAGSVLLLAP